ncbi:Multi-copper polyphenol oxidoreductase laccase [Brevinematales bacterium NS]|nr:polyphenol oxidase family protein [Brevinematales bacterium]QJR23052.1 Multi-copper polyphenol oxidoreductase laccase [Brevinematales bacterium NS]
MTKHPLVLYHHSPLMGSTVRSSHEYAYHTVETPEEWNAVTLSRKSLGESLGFPSIVTLHQTHSATIHRVTEETLPFFLQNPLIEGDGLWTTLDSILLGVFTADCLPIFYWGKEVIGVVHAGRKGVYQEIHRKMILQLAGAGYEPSDIRVLIGPHIRACCYEVGEEIIQEVSSEYALFRNNRWYLDLEAKVKEDLAKDGVKRIETIPFCTFCGDSRLWYSYRRGERRCRHLHFVGKRQQISL